MKKKNTTFLNWIKHTFGKGIARHFMVPYNTKFWTVSPREMTSEWLDGFIPVPSLEQVLEGTLEESQRQFGYNARFWYPRKSGIEAVPRAFSCDIKHIHTNCEVKEINLTKKEIRLSSGDKQRFDTLIYTISLPEFPHIARDIPGEVVAVFKQLRWNSIFNLNLGINKRDTLGFHWIYFPQKEISFFRAGFYHNFSSHTAPSGKGALYIEVSYSKDRPLDKKKIIFAIKKDLKRLGFLKADDQICAEDVNDIEYGYPIYDLNYHSARNTIMAYLLRNRIIPCGRYGS